jgi:hypothetical protein
VSDDFAELAEWVKASARGAGEEFDKPDDDWPAAAFAIKDGQLTQIPLALDKEYWPGILATLAKGATAVAAVYSTWELNFEELPASERGVFERGEVSMSVHPKRREAVLVAVVDRERAEMWRAPIVRDGRQPPRLGEWTRSEGGEGKMIEPIRASPQEEADPAVLAKEILVRLADTREGGAGATAAYESALHRGSYDRDTAAGVIDTLARYGIWWLLAAAQARGKDDDALGDLAGTIEEWFGGEIARAIEGVRRDET